MCVANIEKPWMGRNNMNDINQKETLDKESKKRFIKHQIIGIPLHE